jgi:hypothetical protein
MKRILRLLFISFIFLSTKSFATGSLTISTVALAAVNINQGSTYNIIYIAKLDVGTDPFTVSSVQFNLTGTYDGDDFTSLNVFANTTAPTIAGSVNLGSVNGNADGPHVFTVNTSYTITAGSSVYFIITANIQPAAALNNTLGINGATDPVILLSAYSPVIANT